MIDCWYQYSFCAPFSCNIVFKLFISAALVTIFYSELKPISIQITDNKGNSLKKFVTNFLLCFSQIMSLWTSKRVSKWNQHKRKSLTVIRTGKIINEYLLPRRECQHVHNHAYIYAIIQSTILSWSWSTVNMHKAPEECWHC